MKERERESVDTRRLRAGDGRVAGGDSSVVVVVGAAVAAAVGVETLEAAALALGVVAIEMPLLRSAAFGPCSWRSCSAVRASQNSTSNAREVAWPLRETERFRSPGIAAASGLALL